MVFKGEWLFRWGEDGKDGEFVGRAGDVVSIPTWIFRGFTNIGADDSWIFTALGRDESGGVIWDPKILGGRGRARAVPDPRQHDGRHRDRRGQARRRRADAAADAGGDRELPPLHARADAARA